ncbi:DUF6115 domain-containing protein [Mahella australiensis]|uniref:Uncharacterized protein n=1 Tax=Mahella australiensis (strain DSM 15567 / CIP 107919 / 50-1 BON) TaxID=697281 RepID=F4A1W8_MAHA5|nr:hypothetical protein [Mahella australiensis]AEE96084.1 hypothetical protein Mahau_0886 [Mahella australiensis 50-1 BON]
MYIVLLIGLIFIICSIPLLKRDISVIEKYSIDIENSKRELAELKELKYNILAELEDMLAENDIDNLSSDIVRLADSGYTVSDIARQLGRGIGEVQIMLRVGQMRRQKRDDTSS